MKKIFLISLILVCGACASTQVTRAKIESYEDQFCTAVAAARVVEKATDTTPEVDGGK